LWRYYRTTHTWSGLINTDLCGDWWKRGWVERKLFKTYTEMCLF
jgi:hypothetical protein